jgi:hypothetical protein
LRVLRTGSKGEYLILSERKSQEAEDNYIMRSFIISMGD